MLEKCEGIVIRTVNYGETNKIVTLFTREWGKVGVMARGAKKPNSRLAAVTQPFTYGTYLIQRSRGLGTLQQGEISLSMRSIKEDIFLTAYVSYIVDLLDKGTEEKKPNPYLFELVFRCIQAIDEGYDAEILTHIFEMKMLGLFGLYPELNHCAVCQRTEGTFAFSISQNGFICHHCLDKDPYHLKLSPATVRLLRLFYYMDLSRLGNISVKEQTKLELKKVIETYYDEYAGLQLKTKRFLNQMNNMKGFMQ
ncbi:DNA repair protein RecO [Cytobacillus kochii]